MNPNVPSLEGFRRLREAFRASEKFESTERRRLLDYELGLCDDQEKGRIAKELLDSALHRELLEEVRHSLDHPDPAYVAAVESGFRRAMVCLREEADDAPPKYAIQNLLRAVAFHFSSGRFVPATAMPAGVSSGHYVLEDVLADGSRLTVIAQESFGGRVEIEITLVDVEVRPVLFTAIIQDAGGETLADLKKPRKRQTKTLRLSMDDTVTVTVDAQRLA